MTVPRRRSGRARLQAALTSGPRSPGGGRLVAPRMHDRLRPTAGRTSQARQNATVHAGTGLRSALTRAREAVRRAP